MIDGSTTMDKNATLLESNERYGLDRNIKSILEYPAVRTLAAASPDQANERRNSSRNVMSNAGNVESTLRRDA